MHPSICPTCRRPYSGYDVVGHARMTFTPEMAAHFVGRLSSEENCTRYARIMSAGRWDPGVWPLMIWYQGTMLQGYTRMEAVVRAKCPVEFDVQIITPVRFEEHDGAFTEVHKGQMYSEAEVREFVAGWCRPTSSGAAPVPSGE